MLKTKHRKPKGAPWLAILLALTPFCAAASTCFGTVGNGRLDHGVQLPLGGKNFRVYSELGAQLGRTYMHDGVRQVVLDTYASLEKAAPGKQYVYGETGLSQGGPMRPHRTHQAGLSVDFMVPVTDDAGQSIPLPATALNKFGYGLEFDDAGRWGSVKIDFEAMAEHLYQLSLAAENRSIPIERVIFDPKLSALLFKTSRGPYLQKTLPFMKPRPWIRHDEHYHIDFAVRCLPLAQFRN